MPERQMRSRRTLLLGCALFVAACDRGGLSGTIRGNVSDVSRARVSDAIVVVVNQNADNSIGLKTNRAGEFVASGLQPGTYSVAVSKAGFQSTTKANIVVDANRTVNVDLNMVAGTDPVAAPVKTMERQ
jgi:hypothetical protein